MMRRVCNSTAASRSPTSAVHENIKFRVQPLIQGGHCWCMLYQKPISRIFSENPIKSYLRRCTARGCCTHPSQKPEKHNFYDGLLLVVFM